MNRRGFKGFFVIAVLLMSFMVVMPALAADPPSTASHSLDPTTKFFVPQPDNGAVKQVVNLFFNNQAADAKAVLRMITTPQAVWFTSGTPQDIEHNVRKLVEEASLWHTVPVLVAYNVPGRDCALYSAGGAATGDAYKAWIDGFVKGLGNTKAVVLVEPDGLALLPTDCGQPDTYNRVSLINYAAHALEADKNASVYLDAGNSAWHAVGDIAQRLVDAGIQDVQGFSTNISNYRETAYETHLDTWISECIAFGNNAADGGWRLGHYTWCASQYYSPLGSVNPNDISTWGNSDLWYTQNLGSAVPATHFVVDTSRNGAGPWNAPADHPDPAGNPQIWCNPPSRGVGLLPTAKTGVALLDAYLWVKIPGESDGQCYRWTTGPLDPVRNMADPAAGMWFPEMALELARNANPPLR
jgi:endoglucanase